MVEHAVMIACSSAAGVPGLMEAIGESGNFGLGSALIAWTEEELAIELDDDLRELQGHNSAVDTSTVELLEKQVKDPYESSLSGTSLGKRQNEPKPLTSSSFEQLDDLKKVAVLSCQSNSSTKGTLSMEFNKDSILVYLADGTVYLQNWRDYEYKNKTVQFGAKIKNITSFQYDEEICVLGTENGTVYLFDSKSLEAKWFIRLDISRADMQLLNKRLVRKGARGNSGDSGVFINPCYSSFHLADFVVVHYTESGEQVTNENGIGWDLKAPAEISTLSVVDLISTKNIVVAGCIDGVIAMWDDCFSINRESPAKTLEGHTDGIVSLCSLNGHLLSVDKRGILLMWSGYDLENSNDNTPPVPLLLSQDFYNVNCLVAHDRWFAASSSEDNSVSVWTLPDLWLRCG